MSKTIRAAIYLRVSKDEMTTENQRRELLTAAQAHGWTITAEYTDEGISGSKGRDKRPGLDRMLKDVVRGKVNVVMVWSVDRLGRSLSDLVACLKDIQSVGADLFIYKQAVDTTTTAGKAMFGMLGVFAEFERDIITERSKAGVARAVAAGAVNGRPMLSGDKLAHVRELLVQGNGILKVCKLTGAGSSTVQRIKREMAA